MVTALHGLWPVWTMAYIVMAQAGRDRAVARGRGRLRLQGHRDALTGRLHRLVRRDHDLQRCGMP